MASEVFLWQLSPMRALILIVATMAVAAAQAKDRPIDAVAAFAHQSMHVTNFGRASADLNGDGRPEVLLYVTDQRYCGSGGCMLVILTSYGSGFRAVLRSTVTRLPITLLSTTTHGWRDIGVSVAGGGIAQPYMARLRFNGRRYPSNPTVLPAIALKQPSGSVLIGK